jgi:hypothetical protein
MALGFNINTEVGFFEREALVPNDFKNAMCYGQTGSGKTTGFILPAIKDRMIQNYGLVVFDFKGTLHGHIKRLACDMNRLDKIVEIGPLWGKKINLLKDISASELNRIYRMMHGGSQDPYWQTASSNLVVSLYGTLKTLYSLCKINKKFKNLVQKNDISIEEPSFKTLLWYLNSCTNLSRLINSAGRVHRLFFQELQKSMPERLFFLYEELNNNLMALQEYKNVSNEGSTSGKYGVLGVASSILSGIATQNALNHDEFDWKSALDEGKVLVINSQGMDNLSLSCVSTIIANYLAGRIRINSICHPVSIVIDESHRVLNEYNLPDTDICRESRFEYILATQDRLLMYNKIGQSKTEELLRNIATVYAFKTSDEENLDMKPTWNLKTFEYYDFSTKNSYKAPVIHFDQNSIDEAHYAYLKTQDVLRCIRYRKEEEIPLHDATLAQEHQVILKSIKTGKHRIENYANPSIKRRLLGKKAKEGLFGIKSAVDVTLDKSLDAQARLNNAERLLLMLDTKVKSMQERLKDLA